MIFLVRPQGEFEIDHSFSKLYIPDREGRWPGVSRGQLKRRHRCSGGDRRAGMSRRRMRPRSNVLLRGVVVVVMGLGRRDGHSRLLA